MSKKCPKCGVTSDNGNFCQNCGEKLIEDSFLGKDINNMVHLTNYIL